MARILISGATGFLGRSLTQSLISRGHAVSALVRPGSNQPTPPGCTVLTANPLVAASYIENLNSIDALVQLVGVHHPNPAKASLFRSVDLPAARAAVDAAQAVKLPHFVYVSVAHPAPMMQAYIAVRAEAEEYIRAAGLNATILRPWYVLGPGRQWPQLLRPIYWALETLPSTKASAGRLGLVTSEQMIHSMTLAVERPASGIRILEVPQIRAAEVNAQERYSANTAQPQ